MRTRQARRILTQSDGLSRTNCLRAFWKASLIPIDKERAEGSISITIDSPESSDKKREIEFRCMMFDERLMILGIGKLAETRREDDEIIQRQSPLSYNVLPFNIIEFLIDLRYQIESQWENMQNALKTRLLQAEGIATGRFKHRLTPEEARRIKAVQMHIIDPEINECNGKPENRGSVRQLRPSVEGDQ